VTDAKGTSDYFILNPAGSADALLGSLTSAPPSFTQSQRIARLLKYWTHNLDGYAGAGHSRDGHVRRSGFRPRVWRLRPAHCFRG